MRLFPSKADLSASLHQMERGCQKHIRSPLQKEFLLAFAKSSCLEMANIYNPVTEKGNLLVCLKAYIYMVMA